MSTVAELHLVLNDAVAFMARGWAVAPVYGPDPSRPTGCSCRNPECESPAKHPPTRRGILDASTEERMARIWFERHPTRGIALATGEPSGVWALDLDGEVGKRSFLALQEAHGRIPATTVSRTGGGGFHLLFGMPGDRDVRNSAGQVGAGIDVRGTGGYIVLPPSGHVSGRRYRWARGRSPDEIEVADAPPWLLDLVAPPRREAGFPPPTSDRPSRGGRYIRAAIEAECEAILTAPAPVYDSAGRRVAPGARNETLNRAAFNLARFVVAGEANAPAVARALAHAAARAGLGEREIARTLESAFGARGVA